MDDSPITTPSHSAGKVFATTRWTQVVAARGDSAPARQALSDLCAAYYEPVVTYLRHEGRSEGAARELAHQFFERVLDGRSFDAAAPGHGRFRSYLLGAVKHFLAEDASQCPHRQTRWRTIPGFTRCRERYHRRTSTP
jgi:DNA-directed RNA polymerase specialized sigma24 family protein